MSTSPRAASDERRASPWPKRPAKARAERTGRPQQARDGIPKGAATATPKRQHPQHGDGPASASRRTGRGKGKGPGTPRTPTHREPASEIGHEAPEDALLEQLQTQIKISGDTLALDKAICRQIEREAKKLALRFPEECIDALARINEEFDPLHGHRVRCELRANLGQGRQLVVRDARKDAAEAITEVFGAAKRSLRRLRRRLAPEPIPGIAVV